MKRDIRLLQPVGPPNAKHLFNIYSWWLTEHGTHEPMPDEIHREFEGVPVREQPEHFSHTLSVTDLGRIPLLARISPRAPQGLEMLYTPAHYESYPSVDSYCVSNVMLTLTRGKHISPDVIAIDGADAEDPYSTLRFPSIRKPSEAGQSVEEWAHEKAEALQFERSLGLHLITTEEYLIFDVIARNLDRLKEAS